MDGFDNCIFGFKVTKKIMDIVIKLFAVVSFVLLIVTIILVYKGNNKLKNYNECVGTIIGLHEDTTAIRFNSAQNKSIAPIVSYSVNGQNYEFIGNFYSTNMKVGNQVKVLYSKEDFSKASIKTGVYVAPIITGSLCLFFLIFVVIILILKIKGFIIF